jgi:UPF0042 nucleotide-binding protein
MSHCPSGTQPRVLITSYGVLHGQPPATLLPQVPVTLDLADALRNPHDDPSMRYRTGLDADVYKHVMTTPGAARYRDTAVAEILARVEAGFNLIEVHSFCRGGRHRSVAMAEAVAAEVQARAIQVEVEHRDIEKPVVQPIPAIQEA